MKVKCVQMFSAEYLKKCKNISPVEICQFLDDFRQLYAEPIQESKQDSRVSVKRKK